MAYTRNNTKEKKYLRRWFKDGSSIHIPDNGGTILAISSKEFAVIAGDTRQSEGYSIQTRYAPKVTQLTEECCIAVNGFAADGKELVKQLKQRLQWYQHTHASQPSVQSIARLVQTMLYGRRFFPYYAYVILAGIDRDGTGAVYSFDPVGSYERESCRAAGAAQSLVQPFLDNQVGGKNMTRDPSGPAPPPEPVYAQGQSYTPPRSQLPLEKVQALVTDAFTGAAERHIEVGDGLEIFIIEAGKGVRVVRKELKRD
ncbi:20S proteasome subunit beta 6 [Puccinia graminis f. sp. tritici CRL 75-36-700-3]|uniref:20S proteasome subunit beta 6 n=1 Tax=Puccinia graminis f. sp. tritici (strain CRL 75-36-700-3 / race SCCL) TaxID=418459 RepID=E3KQ17_PUCGT|nr:20S proteasome subunit beta 6 [Puccinia graminis f. sp. tritici CRL 75-36-700-3]EFP86392.2 20S proteasome subunit beta 6 [Puccinia graminis f. sp. tritici CRL 75-36-700-3]